MVRKPKYFRTTEDHIFGWEIYRWNMFFFTFSIGNFEIQINAWGGNK